MATFTPPTYDRPIDNELGKHGVNFPVGKVVYICANSDAHETNLILGNFAKQRCPDGYGMTTGSGDAGYALFRRGGTYTITVGEGTILTAAGYTIV